MFSKRFKWDLETNQLARLIEAKRKSGASILDLTESNPTRAGLDYPTEEILAALAQTPAMFYEPAFYRAFRASVVPLLRTYPFIRLWHVGCATGEEVYSMAILLEEEGLYDRCRLYATDIEDAALKRAREGIFPLASMQEYTANYVRSGGKSAFSEYYTARYEFAIVRPALQRNIVFSQHNLVSDGPFNEFNVILCRNVMIYFNRALQERTHALLLVSLGMFGVLGLGARESLRFLPQETLYEPLAGGERLYRRVA